MFFCIAAKVQTFIENENFSPIFYSKQVHFFKVKTYNVDIKKCPPRNGEDTLSARDAT